MFVLRCIKEDETTNHLLVHCEFKKLVWLEVRKELKFTYHWVYHTFGSSFYKWIMDINYSKEIPCFISWEIWKHMNGILFQDKIKNVMRVTLNVIGCFKKFIKKRET